MSQELLMQLYKRQANIIYGYLLKNGCSKEDAEDIVQDSFVKTIQYMDGIDAGKINSWLFKVALNDFRNRMKRKGVVVFLDINEQSFADRFIADDEFTDLILKEEQKKQVKSCLYELKDAFRDLLIFKYDMELTYFEISKLLGFSEDKVRTYLYRARNEFKKKWEDYYGGQ